VLRPKELRPKKGRRAWWGEGEGQGGHEKEDGIKEDGLREEEPAERGEARVALPRRRRFSAGVSTHLIGSVEYLKGHANRKRWWEGGHG